LFSNLKSLRRLKFLLNIKIIFILLGLIFIFNKNEALAKKRGEEKTTSQLTVPFHFKDVNDRDIKLSAYKGQWVLVNFWAPWCPICMTEIPTLNKLNSYDNRVVLGIVMDYGPDASAALYKINSSEMNYEAHILGGSRRDPNSPYRQVGPVDFFPTSYLYSPTGEIVMFIPGQIRENKIEAFIKDYEKYMGKK